MQTVCNTYWDAGKGNLTSQNTRKPFGGRGWPRTPLRELKLQRSSNRLVGVEGLAVPSQEPHPPLSVLRASPLLPSPPLPHSKISSDAVEYCHQMWWLRPNSQSRHILYCSAA